MTITCPCCAAAGTVAVYITGHVLVIHPGAFLADGRQMADEACILTDEQARALESDAANPCPAPPSR